MATIPINFSVPPPTVWTPVPPPTPPFHMWEKQLEVRFTNMLSGVTDKIMNSISELNNKINTLATVKDNASLPRNNIQPLMALPFTRATRPHNTSTTVVRQGADTRRDPTGNPGRPWTRDILAGPAPARPYQPRGVNSNGRNHDLNKGMGRKPNPSHARKGTYPPHTPKNYPHTHPQANHELTVNAQTHSDNRDMQHIIKAVHTLTSVKHHLTNWSETPKSVMKTIENITSNIKPPLCDDKFQQRAKEVGEHFAQGLAMLVQEHLEDKQRILEQELLLLNPTDKKIVEPIVTKQFLKKQGRKFDAGKIKRHICAAVDLVGFNFAPRPNNNQSRPDIKTFNRFAALELDEETDVESEEQFEDASSQGPQASSDTDPTSNAPPLTTNPPTNPPTVTVPPSTTVLPPRQPPCTSSLSSPSDRGTSPNHASDTSSPIIDTSGHTLRSRKVTTQQQQYPPDYAELKKNNIYIYPNKTRPSSADLAGIPHRDAQVLVMATLTWVSHAASHKTGN